MDRLPILVLKELFEYFSLKEQIKLKLVCKTWFMTLSSRKIKTLCLHSKSFPFNLTWTFTNQLIGHQNYTNYLNRKVLAFAFIKEVKKMYISSNLFLIDSSISANQLQLFSSLEQLEIDSGFFKEKIRFNFKKLKLLSLNRTKFKSLVEIECPKLRVFNCSTNVEQFKFVFPTTIEYLECLNYSRMVKRFKNLRYLIFQSFEPIDLSFSDDLVHLKELHLNIANYIYLDLEDLSSKLSSIKNRFKVFTTFFKCENDLSKFIYTIDSSNVEILKKNYSNLSDYHTWKFKVDYSALLKSFDNSLENLIKSRFLNKFTNIQILVLNDCLQDLESIKLLQNCRRLREIRVSNCLVPSNFYKLLAYFPDLEKLILSVHKFDLNDNYKQINGFKSLKTFKIFSESFLPIELVRFILEKCPNIRKLFFFNFKIQKKQVIKVRKADQLYSVESTFIEIFCDLDDLINELSRLFEDVFPFV